MIHFGTDGWRARLDGDFCEDNVVRIAAGLGEYWSRRSPGAIVYVAYDARPGAEQFACLAAKVLASFGLVLKVSDRPAPTPALSWAVANDPRSCGGISITGSHNPSEYLGIKLRQAGGGTMSEEATNEVELLIAPDPIPDRGPIQRCDIVIRYLDYLCEAVDAQAIADAHLKVVYDPLYGAARGSVPLMMGALGIDVVEIHGEDDADTPDIHPDPIEPWVDECEQAVVDHGACAGLINDGDADRVGAVDERGRYIAPPKIIALTMLHLARHHGLTGRVVVNQSMSVQVRRVAKDLGCRLAVTPAGFKHIYEEMQKGDVLIGGEEAGGIAVPAYCPERDGILINVLLCELIAMSGKPLGTLVDELDEKYGQMSFARRDLRLDAEVIEMFRTLLPGLNPPEIGGREPVRVSHMDGLRLEFEDESWLLVRPSGTESVVRVYAEAPSVERRDELLEAGIALARGEHDEI